MNIYIYICTSVSCYKTSSNMPVCVCVCAFDLLIQLCPQAGVAV